MNSQELGKFVAYKDAVLIDTFIEGRGSKLHDFSKHRNHGTIYGMKWLKGAGSFVIGDYVEVANSASLNITNEITLFGWVKFSGLTGTYQFLIDFKWSDTGYLGAIERGGELYPRSALRDSDGNYMWLVGSTVISDNKWHMLVVTFKNGVTKLYCDGKLEDQASGYAQNLYSSTRSVIISNPRTYPLNGTIDEVRIYRRALTESERKSSYYYSNPHKKPEPTCVTRRGVYQAVKNEGIELTGNSLKCVEAMV